MRRMIRRLRRRLKSAGDAIAGTLAVALLKCLRLTNPDKMANFCGWMMRAGGPWLPENRTRTR